MADLAFPLLRLGQGPLNAVGEDFSLPGRMPTPFAFPADRFSRARNNTVQGSAHSPLLSEAYDVEGQLMDKNA